MRPGQAAPVFRREKRRFQPAARRFNEAGAGCPGIRFGRSPTKRGGPSFNEAGAGCPGIPAKVCRAVYAIRRASMRPGQAAPVFPPARKDQHKDMVGFNEAGAGCPGILYSALSDIRNKISFNEAGAGCPGILFRPLSSSWSDDSASMRPGQAAPVFARRTGWSEKSAAGFNEAGAGCPGIPGELMTFPGKTMPWLQ